VAGFLCGTERLYAFLTFFVHLSFLAIWVVLTGEAGGQDTDELQVRAEVSPGRHYVGQAMDLRVGVIGAGQRPEVDRPSIRGAEVWLVDQSGLKPLSLSGIGGMASGTILFVSRFGVVPRRAGSLEIPAIRAHGKDRSGKSRPVKVTIRPVPVSGRPAEFLGGVGRFTVKAEAEPKVLRVGQELEYCITVTGPAAWGMVDRPELKRFSRLGIGLRIDPKATDLTSNPPSRRFVYRLRPTRPGEEVLPPVAIAGFDPASARYITEVTAGVPIRVVAVPAFDAAELGPRVTTRGTGESDVWAWSAVILSAVLLVGAAVGLARVRHRTQDRRLGGQTTARRFAARLGRSSRWSVVSRGEPSVASEAGGPGTVPGAGADGPLPWGVILALEISSSLVRYLEIGLGRPPGALTPEEARVGVARCTGSDELGVRAAEIAARCDGMLYREAPSPPGEDPSRLGEDARGLFAALGRVRTSSRTLTGTPEGL
jgi:hypothetical protein